MSFEDYLITKKIDSMAFKSAEPDRWEEWNTIFVDLSPASFTAQKLYLINPVRRKYPLKTSEVPKQEVSSETNEQQQKPSPPKPMFKPKIK